MRIAKKMIRDSYIDINKLVQNKAIFKLFRAVENHGGTLRFVGGAVRDVIAKLPEHEFDLDLATDLSPEEVVEACEEKNLKTVPIGLKFGTVGVVIGDKVVEVTSLRRDITTDGRHAEVEFTSDWEVDASRRDLTINAVYADEKGNVFDYYNGIDDIEKGRVRFIGSALQRIREDYLRVLRFFRFYSSFGKGEIDKKALQACIECREKLQQLAIERIRDEMGKLVMTPRAVETLKIMFDNGILEYILPTAKHLDCLAFLIELVNKHKIAPDAMRRLFVMYEPDEKLAENLSSRLKFSKKQREMFIRWAVRNPSLQEFVNEKSLRKLLYTYGRDFCFNKFLLVCALNKQEPENFAKIIEQIESWEIPTFNIKGKHILALGIDDNRKIGTILDKLEELWIESDFKLADEELLAQAKSIIASAA